MHSEEGGRFLNAQSRYLIVEADEATAPMTRPPGYRWVTPGQLTALVRHGHYVNVQARTLLACLHATGAGDLMDALRIGVLGCADIARRRMLPAMAAEPGVRHRRRGEPGRGPGARGRRAVRRAAGARLRRAAGRRTTWTRCTCRCPPALHAEWVAAALRAGKHVLAEKPLTTDLAAADRDWWRWPREPGLVLMENFMFVHHCQHQTVASWWPTARSANSGLPGGVRGAPAARRRHPLPAELGGGALLDTGVYPVRAALHFLGDAARASSAPPCRTARPTAVDTSGAVLLRSPEGAGVQLSFGLDHGYRSMYELWGSEGRITVERAFTPPADHRPIVRVERRGGTEEVLLPADDQVARTVAAFARAVRSGAAPDPVMVSQARLLQAVRARAAA